MGAAERVLVAGEAGDWFWVRPGGEPVSLARHPLLRSLFSALLEAAVHRAGPLSVETLVERLWPDQRILPRAAATRVYTAVRSLRRKGLGPLLRTAGGGYLIEPSVRLVLDPTPAELVGSLPHLPPPPTDPHPLLGRNRESEQAAAWLAEGERMVLLHGPPGIGKSRLARHLAWSVYEEHGSLLFVELSAPATADELVRLVATPLGIPIRDVDATTRVGLALAAHPRFLLVLDGVAPSWEPIEPVLRGWLGQAPALQLLCTARSRPQGLDHVTLSLGPLPPAAAVGLLRHHAERVGVDAAALDERDLAQLAAILGGNPSAILLAAARLRLASPRDLVETYAATTRGGEEPSDPAISPYDVLRSTWQQLPSAQRSALVALSIFESEFPLSWAERALSGLGGPDEILEHLVGLVDRNLLQRRNEGGRTTLRLAPHVVDFVREKSGSPSFEEVRRNAALRLADYLAATLAPGLEDRLQTAERPKLLRRLLAWDRTIAMAARAAAEAGRWAAFDRLFEALCVTWLEASALQTAVRFAGESIPEHAPRATRALQAWVTAMVSLEIGAYQRAEAAAREILEIDDPRVPLRARAGAMVCLAQLRLRERRRDPDMSFLSESLGFLERQGRHLDVARLHVTWSAICTFQGNQEGVRRAILEGQRICREHDIRTVHVKLDLNRQMADFYLQDARRPARALSEAEQATRQLEVYPSLASLQLLIGFGHALDGRLALASSTWNSAIDLLARHGLVEYRRHLASDVIRAALFFDRADLALDVATKQAPFSDSARQEGLVDPEWLGLTARLMAVRGAPPTEVQAAIDRAHAALHEGLGPLLRSIFLTDLAHAARGASGGSRRFEALREEARAELARIDAAPEGFLVRHWKQLTPS